jgi:predicted MFS family arabinose efflux permease
MQQLEEAAIASLSASDPDSSSGPSKHFAAIMALACAVTVANLYYAQPLLQQFAATFHARIADVGVVPSAVQIGYAGGLLFLGPLGDRHARHRLILGLGALLPPALLAAAAAPAVLWLAIAMLVVGLLSSIIQQIIPLVAHVTPTPSRGKAIGLVMSGLMIGILGGRVLAGAIAQWANWRWAFGFGAVSSAAVWLMLWRTLPRLPARTQEQQGYAALMASTLVQFVKYRELRFAALTGALFFGSFSVFWVGLTPLLQSPVYGYGPAVVGAFGLLGIAGASSAMLAGRWSDRPGGPSRVRLIALVTVLLSWAAAAIGMHKVSGLVVGIVAIDAGCQGAHIANLAAIHALSGEARSRINAVYMSAYFGGGAIGSLVASHAWDVGGWPAVVLCGAGFAAAALVVECVT